MIVLSVDCIYYSSISPHYDSAYGKKVVSIMCFYGHSGEYDAETGEKMIKEA